MLYSLIILSGVAIFVGSLLSPITGRNNTDINFLRPGQKQFNKSKDSENNYKSGRTGITYINENGYRCFKDSNILFHRWMMEKHLGRKLRPGEVVHHTDGNKLNNYAYNLMVFPSQEAHDSYHRYNFHYRGTWRTSIL